MQGMTPLLSIPIATALALGGAVALPAWAAPPTPHTAPGPSFLQVTQDEWFLQLSRQTVRSGLVVLETVNGGMDDHDLALRRRAPGARTLRIPRSPRGGRVERELRLAAGTYDLWCTLPGHRAQGMKAKLRVVAKKAQA